jgi:hypothetical protein
MRLQDQPSSLTSELCEYLTVVGKPSALLTIFNNGGYWV